MIVLVDNGSPVAVSSEETKFIYNLLPVGRFYDKRYGEINISPEKIKMMADNFGKFPSYEVPIKLGHSDGAKSPGKVIGVEAKDNGLEITMLVDAETAKDINEKKYRYMSAEFEDNYLNKETGENVGAVLLGAALVNQPANPYMQPLMFADTTFNIDFEGDGENMTEVETLRLDLSDVKAQLQGVRAEADEKIKLAEEQAERIAQLEAQNKALLEERKRAEDAKNEAEVKAFAEKWTAAGIPPVVIDKVKPVLLAETSRVMKFSDNAKDDVPTLKFFDDLFAGFPKMPMRQIGGTDGQGGIELSDIEKEREHAKAIAASLN